MRALGRLMTFLGLVTLLAGGYGYAAVHSSFAPGLYSWVAEAYVHIGGLSFSLTHPQFLFRGLQAFTATYRLGLALGGLGGIMVGGILINLNKRS